MSNTSDAFMVAFGSALSLHRDGGQLFVSTEDGIKRPISIAQAELIGDDFHRFAQCAKDWLQDGGRSTKHVVPTMIGRLGGEAHGDD